MNIRFNENTMMVLRRMGVSGIVCIEAISLVLPVIVEPPCKTAMMNKRRRLWRIKLR